MFAVCFIKFLMYWIFFGLYVPKSHHKFVNIHNVINWRPEERNDGSWKIKICCICGNLLELNFFKLLSGRDSKEKRSRFWSLKIIRVCVQTGNKNMAVFSGMTRVYRRKTAKAYHGYRMECALKTLDGNLSLRAAAWKFNMPFTTLRRRHSDQMVKSVGKPVNERRQKSMMKALSFHRCTFQEMRKKALVFGSNMNTKLPANWKLWKTVGIEWMRSFLKKYSHLNVFLVKGKSYCKISFICIRCSSNRERRGFKFLCEKCCLCTCNICFAKMSMCCEIWDVL